MIHFSTTVTAIGEEVADLLDGGVLILYADGAPAALAEVSVQHRVDDGVTMQPPTVGARLTLGELSTRISAVGSTAWLKVLAIVTSLAICMRVIGVIWLSGSKLQCPMRINCCCAFRAGPGNWASSLLSAMLACLCDFGRFAPITGTPARTAVITAGP